MTARAFAAAILCFVTFELLDRFHRSAHHGSENFDLGAAFAFDPLANVLGSDKVGVFARRTVNRDLGHAGGAQCD
ncbi:hypothetical protein [Rubripirellula tenax]|uniref:hypothetical protein n=1 Tax=Rubripirellula tenax TaxID=2528015 RepID=UPI00164745BE|nr:hypothetical protein [Rubripirellula tenax]